jgi:hypothetical protein
VELAFCLRLILKFPVLSILPNEKQKYDKENIAITKRIEKFIFAWKKKFPQKCEKDMIVKHYLDIDYTQLNMEEFNNTTYNIPFDNIMKREDPWLNNRLISTTQLIQNSLFIIKDAVDEIARQICMIDQDLLLELQISDYLREIKNDYSEKESIFAKIISREQIFKAYILFSIYILVLKKEDIKSIANLIDLYISLAFKLKNMNNFQSFVTIIKTFQRINLKQKSKIWSILKDINKTSYLTMLLEVDKIEMNTNFLFGTNPQSNYMYNQGGRISKSSSSNQNNKPNLIVDVRTKIPNIITIKSTIDSIKRKLVSMNVNDSNWACEDFKNFHLKIEEMKNNRYTYYLNNPIHDFVLLGFKEIFRTDIFFERLPKMSSIRKLIEEENKNDIEVIINQISKKLEKYDDNDINR